MLQVIVVYGVGTPVITDQSCPKDWLAQFNLTNVYTCGLNFIAFIFYISLVLDIMTKTLRFTLYTK